MTTYGSPSTSSGNSSRSTSPDPEQSVEMKDLTSLAELKKSIRTLTEKLNVAMGLFDKMQRKTRLSTIYSESYQRRISRYKSDIDTLETALHKLISQRNRLAQPSNS